MYVRSVKTVIEAIELENTPLTKMMPTFYDVLWFKIFLTICVIIVILLPLVPNMKLRYYSCYICYILVMAIGPTLLAPIIMMRPRSIDNMRMIGNALRHFTKIIGIKWELRNGDTLKKDQEAIIVANHQSAFDVMDGQRRFRKKLWRIMDCIISAYNPINRGMLNIWEVMAKCTAIAKKELLYAIPFGPVAWLSGLVFIDRGNSALANNNINDAAKVMKKNKAKLWFFPEGTRNRQAKSTLPFKNGAFRIAIESQVPIIPLVYSPYSFIDSKNKTFSKGKIIISVLEPIPTEGLTMNDLHSLKEKVHRLMSDEYQKLKKETAMSKINLI